MSEKKRGKGGKGWLFAILAANWCARKPCDKWKYKRRGASSSSFEWFGGLLSPLGIDSQRLGFLS